MIFEYRQAFTGDKRQEDMPLAVFIFAQYAFEANEEFKKLGGYFDRKEGETIERWVAVEQGDGFWDEEIQDIAKEHLVDQKRLWTSKTYIDEPGYDGVEEFWVAIVK
jgi:hypothetical protein